MTDMKAMLEVERIELAEAKRERLVVQERLRELDELIAVRGGRAKMLMELMELDPQAENPVDPVDVEGV